MNTSVQEEGTIVSEVVVEGDIHGYQNTHTDEFEGSTLDAKEAKLQRTLRYYFMTPWEKYKAKKRVPYKFFLQLAKIIFITGQLIIFGYNSSAHVTFLEANVVAFKHLFLRTWDDTRETLPYPPSHGVYAVYTYPELYDMLDFVLARYNQTLNLALGSYAFDVPDTPVITLCKRFYRNGSIFASNQSFFFDSDILHSCHYIEPVRKLNATDNTTYLTYDSEQWLAENNMTLNFDRLLDVRLNFSLKSVQLKSFEWSQIPDCYLFHIKVSFDNSAHNGQIAVNLNAVMSELPCTGTVINSSNAAAIVIALLTTVDVCVLLMCFLSAVLCMRSMLKAWALWNRIQRFFKRYRNRKLDEERWEFIDLWFALIILTDVLVIVGSVYKMRLDKAAFADYEVCSYLLGLGSLFVWLGGLRYLGFWYKTNILILTLKRALPAVLRFIFCAVVLYTSFALCAWVVIGPYHIKFRGFFSTLECLFALINGDDVYGTFSVISMEKGFIFYFARVYLYVFCTLFVFIVLNIFITLIIEAYQEIKNLEWNKGRPDNAIWAFIRECHEDASSPLFLSDELGGGRLTAFEALTDATQWCRGRVSRLQRWCAGRRAGSGFTSHTTGEDRRRPTVENGGVGEKAPLLGRRDGVE